MMKQPLNKIVYLSYLRKIHIERMLDMEPNEFNPNQKTEETGLVNRPKDTNHSNRKRRPFLSHIVSGVAGGIVTAIVIIAMFVTNVIPISSQNQNEDDTIMNQNETNEEVQTVSTDLSENTDPALNIDQVTKAVVGVTNLQERDIWSNTQEAGAGTGVIYKKDNGNAYIVTNNHVVENAQEVEVNLENDKKVKAEILGTDPLTDLAVLKIDGSEVDTVAEFASSKDLKVGQTVVAIGNPLGAEFYGTVTKGIISGLDRSIEVDTDGDRRPDWVTEVIQTDAAINPGNSGGALVNTDGKVIGINSMKIAQHAVEGIGLAIPSDSALPIMEQLEKNGEVTRPLIGIKTVEVNQVPLQYRNHVVLPEDVEGGMVIADVEDGTPADEAGLEQFDIITKIDDQTITSLLDLRVYMYNETKVGDTLEIEYVREGKKETTELTLTAKRD